MKKQSLAALTCIAVLLTSFLTGFLVSKDYSKKPVQMQGGVIEPSAAKPVSANADDGYEAARITPSTKMIYEYYYTGDDIVEVAEEMPPYFLLDKTKDNVEEMFSEWLVTSFTPETVVMRKYLDGSSAQYYIVGIQEGFVAVFYATEINGTNLKEVTDIPAKILPGAEQERLKAGIHVLGQEALGKVLEDYGS